MGMQPQRQDDDMDLVTGMARRALSRIPAEIKQRDLLVDGYDGEPTYWYIHIEPVKPAATIGDGTLLAPDESMEAERFKTNIGRVLKLGMAALEGTTRSGIALKDIIPGLSKPKDLIGRYFVYDRDAGRVMTFRTGEQYLITEAISLTTEVKDPSLYKFYL